MLRIFASFIRTVHFHSFFLFHFLWAEEWCGTHVRFGPGNVRKKEMEVSRSLMTQKWPEVFISFLLIVRAIHSESVDCVVALAFAGGRSAWCVSTGPPARQRPFLFLFLRISDLTFIRERIKKPVVRDYERKKKKEMLFHLIFSNVQNSFVSLLSGHW